MIGARGSGGRGLTFGLVTLSYIVAGKLGLLLAFVNASATAVWPPTGIAIAALLLFGPDLWPAIAVGAFVVNIITSGDVASSVGIAIGNTLEAVIATWLVVRWAGGRAAFERPPDVVRFALLAAVLATVVSATIGVTSLCLVGLAQWSDFGPIWLTWWMGDASGALLLTPFLVLWATNRRPPLPERLGEAALLAVASVATGLFVFGGLVPLSTQHYPVAFLTFPVLVVAAFRFGPREAATATLVIAGIAVWGTLRGFGPYALEAANESLLVLQGFMAVAAVTSLVLAAAVFDRHRAEARMLTVEQRSRRVAEDATQLREDFLSIATHELRTPLTSLSGYAQLAQRALAAGRMDRLGPAVDSIVRQSSRLGVLITQLLDAAHIQSGQLALELRPSDLSALTSEVVEAARQRDDGEHRWVLNVDPGIHASVDPLRWEQLLVNLLDNATKYSAAQTTVTIDLHQEGGGPISLAVADEGIGISEAEIPHVFDRFYRAPDRRGLGGLGLGLYVAREIVQRHGGHIGVSAQEGHGTTFTVTLPAGPTAITPTPGAEKPATTAGSFLARRILVVDDDPDIRAVVEAVLREAGHTVISAENGAEALALAARERPDLILLDKLMPVMDGTAFAQAYRQAAADPAPIVAFCAARDAEAWARSIGAQTYIGKPFDVDDLSLTVRGQIAALGS